MDGERVQLRRLGGFRWGGGLQRRSRETGQEVEQEVQREVRAGRDGGWGVGGVQLQLRTESESDPLCLWFDFLMTHSVVTHPCFYQQITVC